jgi:hypothetical protein
MCPGSHPIGAREMENLTTHAAQRAQQRSIATSAIEIVRDYGVSIRRHGADIRYLDRDAHRHVRRALGDREYARLGRKLNIYVVEEGGMICTVAHRLRRIRR